MKPGISIWPMAFLLVWLTTACDYTLAGKWQYKEVSRTRSPDDKVDAVVVEGDAGATTSVVSKVYLVPAGAKVRNDESASSVFAGDHIKGLKLVWKEPKLISIQYDEARIVRFKNFWRTPELQNHRYVVEIRLEPTSADFSLPLSDR